MISKRNRVLHLSLVAILMSAGCLAELPSSEEDTDTRTAIDRPIKWTAINEDNRTRIISVTMTRVGPTTGEREELPPDEFTASEVEGSTAWSGNVTLAPNERRKMGVFANVSGVYRITVASDGERETTDWEFRPDGERGLLVAVTEKTVGAGWTNVEGLTRRS